MLLKLTKFDIRVQNKNTYMKKITLTNKDFPATKNYTKQNIHTVKKQKMHYLTTESFYLQPPDIPAERSQGDYLTILITS